MGQRVNIQYSVELEELQEEVNRLFDKTTTELISLGEGWGTNEFVAMDVAGIEMIDDIRQRLTRVDIMLGDIQNIVQGYVRFRAGPLDKTQNQPSPDFSNEVVNSNELEEKIAKFREMAGPVISEYGGKILVVNPTPEVREGPDSGIAVVIEFENIETARNFYESEKYTEAKAVREEGSEADLILVEGV